MVNTSYSSGLFHNPTELSCKIVLFFQPVVQIYYYFGQIIGILTLGYLADGVLKTKLYLTLSFSSLLQIFLIIIFATVDFSGGSFNPNSPDYGEKISIEVFYQSILAIPTGIIMGALNFLYVFLLPFKIVSVQYLPMEYLSYLILEQAREVTEKRMKKQIGLDRISFIGTILGVILGITDILNTILFPNLLFIVRLISNSNIVWPLLFIISLLILSNLAIYQGIKKEALQFRWVKKLCPSKLKSYNLYYNNE